MKTKRYYSVFLKDYKNIFVIAPSKKVIKQKYNEYATSIFYGYVSDKKNIIFENVPDLY